jgi:ribosomal protein L30/L7E
MDNLKIMLGLGEARKLIRDRQASVVSSSPIVWDMLQRVIRYIDAEQETAFKAIRS